jgi:hypothetical protein
VDLNVNSSTTGKGDEGSLSTALWPKQPDLPHAAAAAHARMGRQLPDATSG